MANLSQCFPGFRLSPGVDSGLQAHLSTYCVHCVWPSPPCGTHSLWSRQMTRACWESVTLGAYQTESLVGTGLFKSWGLGKASERVMPELRRAIKIQPSKDQGK